MHLIVCCYHVTYGFQSESTLYSLHECQGARSRHHIWSLSASKGIRTDHQLVLEQTLNHLAKLAKRFMCVVSILFVRCIWLYVIIMSHTSFKMNSHSVVCPNVKELLALRRRHILSLRDSNEIRTHNSCVHKRIFNHLAKLAKWLSCSIPYSLLDCLGTPCLKQAPYLKFKWQQRDSNLQPLIW